MKIDKCHHRVGSLPVPFYRRLVSFLGWACPIFDHRRSENGANVEREIPINFASLFSETNRRGAMPMHIYKIGPRSDQPAFALISNLLCIWPVVLRRARLNRQYSPLRAVLQPLTWRRDSRLRWCWQRDRDARAQGRFQRVVAPATRTVTASSLRKVFESADCGGALG